KRNFLGGGGKLFRLGGRRGFHFTLPFKGDQGPASVVHFGKVSGSGEDADSFAHAIDLFHGSLQVERSLDAGDAISRRRIGNLHAVGEKSGSHRFKKTSGKEQRLGPSAVVRSRDASVALSDILGTRGRWPGRPKKWERKGLHRR